MGEKAIIAGIDEAGRGCVFGSLFLCAFSSEASAEGELRTMGVKDSKMLLPSQREKLYSKLIKMGDYAIAEYSAERITELMRKRVSLNSIEAVMVVEALTKLKTSPSKVFVDSPDSIPAKFERRIRKFYGTEIGDGIEFICENKADFKYPVVSAASIIAKVLRDEQIERLQKQIGDFGSGYTSDPKTIAFLEKHWKREDIQPFLRHEWMTIKNKRSTQLRMEKFFE